MHTPTKTLLALACVSFGSLAAAADWSDTSIGLRYGNKFAEPFAGNDIHKVIVNLNHVSGYKYGTNFFNADVLLSDSKNPGAGTTEGAQEAYVVYRNSVDIGKVMGKDLKSGGIRGYAITAGIDLNAKNDAYSSKKRMVVVGPTLMLDVPGFVNLSVLGLWESNAPAGVAKRYTYDTHAAFEVDWGIPFELGPVSMSFGGFGMIIASKGKNEFGGDTKTETHIDAKVMADVGTFVGAPKKTLLLGVGYEYWKNKFGNDAKGAAGSGAFAKTPMIRAEYHF